MSAQGPLVLVLGLKGLGPGLDNLPKSATKRHQNFKTSYLGLGMNFLDIFRAQNDRLVVGYLMGKEIFEFQPNLCLWQISWARNGQIENFKRPKSSTGNGEVIYLRIRVEKMLFMAENILEPSCVGGLLFVDFALACCQPNGVINRFIPINRCPLPCPWTPPVPSIRKANISTFTTE